MASIIKKSLHNTQIKKIYIAKHGLFEEPKETVFLLSSIRIDLLWKLIPLKIKSHLVKCSTLIEQKLFFNFNLLFYVSGCFAFIYGYVYTTCVLCLWRPKEGAGFFGTAVTDRHEPHCGCWDSTHGPLLEELMLLTTESFSCFRTKTLNKMETSMHFPDASICT